MDFPKLQDLFQLTGHFVEISALIYALYMLVPGLLLQFTKKKDLGVLLLIGAFLLLYLGELCASMITQAPQVMALSGNSKELMMPWLMATGCLYLVVIADIIGLLLPAVLAFKRKVRRPVLFICGTCVAVVVPFVWCALMFFACTGEPRSA